jgi:hypothetical protein
VTQREVFEWRRREVADRILADPEHFDMYVWGTRSPQCGTNACLAGHAILLAEEEGKCTPVWREQGFGSAEMRAVKVYSKGLMDIESLEDFAMDYLGMTNGCLFHELDMGAEEAAKALLEEPYDEEAIS